MKARVNGINVATVVVLNAVAHLPRTTYGNEGKLHFAKVLRGADDKLNEVTARSDRRPAIHARAINMRIHGRRPFLARTVRVSNGVQLASRDYRRPKKGALGGRGRCVKALDVRWDVR